MPRDSSGVYTLPDGYLATTGQTILASQHNAPLEDIASALTGSLPRNGTSGMLANLPMGGFKITGLANGTSSTDAITKGQLDAVTTGTVTETGTQTLSNKTLSLPTIVLKQSVSPTPTANGDIQWDNDDFALAVGNGSSTKLFLSIPSGTAIGDLEYFSAVKAKARLGIGTAGQVLQVNAVATAPQWATLPFVKSYESAQQTWTNGGTLTLTHGLGSQPKLYHAYAVCISPDGGYSIGDEILLSTWASDVADGRGVSLRPDATSITVFMGTSGLIMLSTTGVYNYKSNPASTWKLIIRAWA